jgi:hypothetical protein
MALNVHIRCQYLYCCTGKASKSQYTLPNACTIRADEALKVNICTVVLVKPVKASTPCPTPGGGGLQAVGAKASIYVLLY